MRAVSKVDYAKGGNVPSYEVLKVVTDGGEFNPDELYFHDYDEDTEYLCWEERRADFANSAMNAMLANPELLQVVTSKEYVVGTFCQNRVAKVSVDYADALIAELKKTNETK